MKTIAQFRAAAFGAVLAAACLAAASRPASAIQWRAQVSLGNAGPSQWGRGPEPEWIAVADGPIQYCGDYPEWDVYRCDNSWYGYHGGSWYTCAGYRAPWVAVRRVPRNLIVVARHDWRADWRGRGHGRGWARGHNKHGRDADRYVRNDSHYRDEGERRNDDRYRDEGERRNDDRYRGEGERSNDDPHRGGPRDQRDTGQNREHGRNF